MGDGQAVEFLILGPVEVRVGDKPATIAGGRQRALLAALLLNANTVVSRASLIDQLFDGDLPEHATHALSVQTSRLRSALTAAGIDPARLVARAPGYVLHVAPGELDLHVFEELVLEGRRAASAAKYEEAVRAFRQADGLWRGPPLADFQCEAFARGRADHLNELRLAAIEERIDAELVLGQHRRIVAELEALLIEHPLRERLLCQLMMALYRSGRQADALDAYLRARSVLNAQLGLEPGPEVRELQTRILRQDPDLEPPPPADHAADGATTTLKARAANGRRILATTPFAAVAVCLVIAAALFVNRDRATGLDRVLQTPGLETFDAASGRPVLANRLSADPTDLTTGFGSVWATSFDEGTVTRVAPRALTVTQTIRVGTGASGIAAAGGDIWVADSLDDGVTRIDPDTDQIVQRIRVGSDPTQVDGDGGTVWVANTGDGTVTEIAALTGDVIRTIPVGPSPRGMAVDDGSLWVALEGGNTVAQVDPRSGRLEQKLGVGSGPSALAVNRAGVWVTNTVDSTVSLISPRADAVVLTRAVPEAPDALAVTPSAAWVAGGTAQITRLSPTGGAHTITTASYVDALTSNGGSLLVGFSGTGVDHRGGTLYARIADPAFEPFDPTGCCDIPSNVLDLSYDGLLALSKSPSDPGQLVPDLALAIPAAQDGGRTYTFRLRPGLRYWNGAPVRASDFLRGFEHAASSSEYVGYLSALTGASACPKERRCDLSSAITADNRTGTVILHLAHPDPNLLTALAQPAFAPDPGGDGVRPGTGPYRVVRQVVGHLLVFARNRYFHDWSPAAQPAGYPNKIVLRVDGTAAGDVAAVAAGRADWTFDAPTARQIAAIDLRAPQLLHRYAALAEEWADLDTQDATVQPTERASRTQLCGRPDDGCETVGGPQQAAPSCQILPPGTPGYVRYCPYTRDPSPSGRWTAPNLRLAHRLIASSGTARQRVTVTLTPSQPQALPVARYLVGLLDRLGYRARLREAPNSVLDQLDESPQFNLDSTWAGIHPRLSG